MSDLDAAIESLRRAGYIVREPTPPPPENFCYKCGKTDSENEEDGFGPCVDIRVIVAYGEEGYDDVTHYVCNDHLVSVTKALIDLGFGVHKHGGIHFLEIEDCPGFSRSKSLCPTPDVDDD